ncbi:Acyl carrier protein [Lentzea fradiae]|uniref:Acyl carrier protein n=1 Tax=Lentzea fradiae TaxID=200378 RepID=A0A1G8APC2_9PSEU|nr:acyl carrier protein [Lentzea fradiae]SDH22596.1 Acyl carrier protein [Lentzea fradiae]
MTDETLTSWLLRTVSSYLDVPEAGIDPAVRLQALGLDSAHAMALCVDIEERWGVLVDPALVWDHPTINAIRKYLEGQLAAT